MLFHVIVQSAITVGCCSRCGDLIAATNTLFRFIANNDSDSESLRNRTKMTRKQYYSGMSRLMKAGLVKRKNGKHNLTAFGKVIYETQITIENAINNYWKLKAIDSLEMSDDLPVEERKKLIDNLIENT